MKPIFRDYKLSFEIKYNSQSTNRKQKIKNFFYTKCFLNNKKKTYMQQNHYSSELNQKKK